MSRWNIKTSGLFVLGCVIFFMLLIVVSPDVDLPDAAFHHGTAPAVVHAQVRTAPAASQVANALPSLHLAQSLGNPQQATLWLASPRPNFRPILLCSIRC